MKFDDINFQGGIPTYICELDEDMLEIRYANGYMIDVGYIEECKTFYVTVVKNNDWTNIINELSAKTEFELKSQLNCAIFYVIDKIKREML